MTAAFRILIIDDEPAIVEATAEALERAGYACLKALSAKSGKKIITGEHPDIVITDLVLRDGDGMDVLRHAKKTIPVCEVVVITGYGSIESAVQAMQEGAATYLRKPLNIDELRAVVARAAEKQKLARDNITLHAQLDRRFGLDAIAGNSPSMQHVFEVVRQVAPTNATVLITGESGTGKELIARAIHANSFRKQGPFVALHCAALPEGVLESELFGHEKGAFTGAIAQRKGRFEYADGGTLFLDEISEIPPTTQTKLLRVIEEYKIMRIGSNTPVDVDVRLIAATNRDLEKLVASAGFREDLYYRLKVVTLHLPPLRERPGDVSLLIDVFLKELGEEYGKEIKDVEPEVPAAFETYPWPGNVRELRNCLESIIALNNTGKIALREVPENIRNAPGPAASASDNLSLEESEKRLIELALQKTGGNRKKAARLLGASLRTLYRKIKSYNIG
ncbi:MAG: sigma-54 dependent transcriptional regulator [Planctomycetota bacterium]